MRTISLLSLLLLVMGCAPAGPAPMADGLTLRLTPERPRAAGEVTLRLRNDTAERIGYNLCTSSLMRRAGDDWEPVPEDRFCTMELRLLDPGAEADFSLELPAELEEGAYRYQTRIEYFDRGEGDTLATEPFTLAG